MSQSDRVTDLIMHYYMEHGRNRDLEKYLRLRRMSNATRSSSDGSLPCMDELQRRACGHAVIERSGVGKSMENLSTLRKKAEQQQLNESEKSLRNASADSAKSNAKKTPDKGGVAVAGPVDAKPETVTVREKKVEQKSGRNFNFNLESVIEINLPPPPTITLGVPSTVAPITYVQPEPLPQAAPSMVKELSPRIVLHESSTQTAVTEDDPIRPVVKTLVPGTVEEPLDSTKDLSPGSSIASNKQRLEWDSLGDIGYDSSERLQFCGAADLNETEKRCLQRYFARKGLTFDRSVIVVRQREEKEKKAARAQDASIVGKVPDAQSTPKPAPPSQPPPQVKRNEREEAKATQTTLHTRGRESRGVQVTRRHDDSSPSYQRQDKAIGTTDSYTLAGSVDAAESFEFFSPSVPETENNTPSVAASASPPAASSTNSTTTSSSVNEASTGGRSLRPTFDDEVKLGLTLYNSICELASMPTGVKESLIDKIFRKLARHDPKRRTREQLLQDYRKEVRQQREREVTQENVASSSKAKEKDNVYDDVSPCSEKDASPPTDDSPQLDRSIGTVEVIELTKDPAQEPVGSENVSEGAVQSSASGSIEENNVPRNTSTGGMGSIAHSSQRTVSSQPVSAGTTKENPPRKMSAPEPRDWRVRKAMKQYLQPMTQSEVEYENFKQLQQLNQERAANDPQLAKIDREIEQLLVRKMLLLNAGSMQVTAGPTLAANEPVTPATALPSERSGTVYTSVHDPVSGNSSSSKNSTSSAWNSHYHMAKVIKNRSKLETPVELTSTPSDVSIPTFVKRKKEKFVENYDQVRTRRVFEEQNHLYTRPYSSGGGGGRGSNRIHLHLQQEKENHHQAFGQDRYARSKLSKAVGPTDCRQPVSSSNDTTLSPEFISSDSISIPVVTTLTNTTTTHHYDIKSRRPSPMATRGGRTAGTQTTDSILRTKPIFGEKKQKVASVQVPSTVGRAGAVEGAAFPIVQCNCPCGQQQREQRVAHERFTRTAEAHAMRTEIVDGTATGRQDKQAQTKPSSIAYVITFEGTTGSERNRHDNYGSAPPVHHVSSSDGESNSACESELENGKDNESEKMLTLREQFRRSCPATLSRIEQRRQCISELNKLRSKRNQQRQRLLLLTSDDSLRKPGGAVGRSQLPPPPLSQRRVFASTRAIRENTRRQVRNLPEVQRKREIERINNLKRKNRIIKDVYNKNLQRKVLKGQVDLSNSVRVIQD